MSETLNPAPPFEKHLRLDEIRRGTEDQIDDIFLAQAMKSRSLITQEDGYLVTRIMVSEPYGDATAEGAYSTVKLKHGLEGAEDRYQVIIQDKIGHRSGIVKHDPITYKFKMDSEPLEGQITDQTGEKVSGWVADRSEELNLQFYLTQSLRELETPEAKAA